MGEIKGMNKRGTNEVFHICDCVGGCTRLVAERFDLENHDSDYEISFQTDCIVNNEFSIRNRIRGAWRMLFGKPICYASVWFENGEGYEKFLNDALGLVGKENPKPKKKEVLTNGDVASTETAPFKALEGTDGKLR